MRFHRQVLGLVVSMCVLAGCATNPSATAPEQPASQGAQQEGGLVVKDERILQGPSCGTEGPPVCPEGLTCAFLELASGRRGLCVDAGTVCEQLTCSSGECVVLESLPLQVRCSQ